MGFLRFQRSLHVQIHTKGNIERRSDWESFLIRFSEMFFSFLLLRIGEGKPTILISSDGFRWDYLGRTSTPGLEKIKSTGVHAKNLINTFATVTFPNHYTMATGLYQESHGIIDNEMFDPEFNETFDMSNVDPKWWSGGEPIWKTAEKAGIKSVCVNWVGCPVEGQRPAIWNAYDGSISYNDRVDKVVDALESGSATLGLLYFEEPDHSCHIHGTESQEVTSAILRVDRAIQRLLSRIDLNKVNVIFTADHGGVDVGNDKIVVLENFSNIDFRLASGGAVAHVWPTRVTDTEQLVADLASIPSSQANCYPRDQVPARLHYSNNRRIAPVVCIAGLGWTLFRSQAAAESFPLKGSHGYDATLDDNNPMRPVFLASGPDFVHQDDPVDPFTNVDLFPLVAELIGLEERYFPPINGSIDGIRESLLASHTPRHRNESDAISLALGFTLPQEFVVASIERV